MPRRKLPTPVTISKRREEFASVDPLEGLLNRAPEDRDRADNEEDWSSWSVLASSNVNAVRYNRVESLLQVQFKNASIYTYSTVPEAVHLELLQTNSPGTYVHRNLKGRFPHARLV